MPHATEEYLGNSTKHNKTWKNCVIHSTEVVERDAWQRLLFNTKTHISFAFFTHVERLLVRSSKRHASF